MLLAVAQRRNREASCLRYPMAGEPEGTEFLKQADMCCISPEYARGSAQGQRPTLRVNGCKIPAKLLGMRDSDDSSVITDFESVCKQTGPTCCVQVHWRGTVDS